MGTAGIVGGVGELNMRHTPGPWNITASRVDAYTYYLAGNTIGLQMSQREANAKLISAAPEMLSILKRTHAELQEIAKDVEELLLETARVIAKAEVQP